jgi:hypothetical protein
LQIKHDYRLIVWIKEADLRPGAFAIRELSIVTHKPRSSNDEVFTFLIVPKLDNIFASPIQSTKPKLAPARDGQWQRNNLRRSRRQLKP